MIELIDVNYRVAEYAILTGINLKIHKGECILLAGESGSGKTTLTKLINGLIPHFYSYGQLDGDVRVQGESVAETSMYKLAEKTGNVFQNPKSQFFYTDSSNSRVEKSRLSHLLRHMLRSRKFMCSTNHPPIWITHPLSD